MATNDDSAAYFFCEPAWATAGSSWHIRPSGPKGICHGGGADTAALCGLDVSWDIPKIRVCDQSIDRLLPDLCRTCVSSFERRGGKP